MQYYTDVILPLAVPKPFTYAISHEENQILKLGFRVAVPFGKRKIYTAIVVKVHSVAPQTYEAKPIAFVFDEQPIVTGAQLDFWKWMSSYYLCSSGEILRAALPAPLLLESETIVVKRNIDEEQKATLSDEQFLIYEALEQRPLTIENIMSIVERKTVMPVLQQMLVSETIELKQYIKEKYKPKYVRYVRLHKKFTDKNQLSAIFEQLKRAPKQLQLLLSLFDKNPSGRAWCSFENLRKKSGVGSNFIKALIKKEVFEETVKREDRISIEQQSELSDSKKLSAAQQKALNEIKFGFKSKDIVLFEGVTASGKTEVYIKLIEEQLTLNKQVLYLLPEISLTSQIVAQLISSFGGKVCVYHSKFSAQERTEIWNNVLNGSHNSQIIVGTRSAILLPFKDLGVIIIDEEHEPSYKQFDPAPRYHARDSAVYLARLISAKVLLGSATPSIETAFNARNGKFGWVKLRERFSGVEMPEIKTIDLKEAYRKKQIKGAFSSKLIEAIRTTLEDRRQVILFQNRRGYAPILECLSCGHIPQCTQCDVTLTFHQTNDQLRCHYCGFHIKKPVQCHACGMPTLNVKGVGTQQIQEQVKNLFPDYNVGRMDWDSTRGKWDFDKIIKDFAMQKTHVLVGTQMIVKGLDFENVKLVGVLNTDHLLHFPDFRAYERSFQMLSQVAGRSGRSNERGLVLMQTFNPKHPVLTQVVQSDYDALYEDQLSERDQFCYPPFCKMIRVVFKNKNLDTVNISSNWFANVIRQSYKGVVLGPVFPAVARVRNLYIKQLLIKMDGNKNRIEAKKMLLKTYNSFTAISDFRNTRINFDVDPF